MRAPRTPGFYGFIPDPMFERQIRKEAEYLDGMRTIAEPALSLIEELAPEQSGDYRDTLEVVVEGDGVNLASTDPAGNIIEWGSANNPPFAPIRRGVRAAGLRLDEESK
jgi:hypothetical protein